MMELADDLELGQKIEPVSYRPRTLKNEIERGGTRKRLPATACLEIATALAHGLQLLHDAGYTHRDVRPANIIFVNAMPKLADIDLLAGHDAALPSYIPRHYAAPEGAHSRQADIYSLGKTIYEMFTGMPVENYPTLPADLGSWADHRTTLRINTIVARACERHPRRRYQSVQQLVDDLLSIH